MFGPKLGHLQALIV